MNTRINLNDLLLEILYDLELLPKTYVTDTAPFRTGEYYLYRTSLPGEIHYHRRRGRRGRVGNASQTPLMPHDEFISLRISKVRVQDIGKLLNILLFCAVARTLEENLGTIPGICLITSTEA